MNNCAQTGNLKFLKCLKFPAAAMLQFHSKSDFTYFNTIFMD